MYKRPKALALLLFPLLSIGSIANAQDEGLLAKELVTRFWQATSDEEKSSSREALLSAAPDAESLYRWFQAGPDFVESAATGEIESERFNEEGLGFPYAFLIPDSYDSRKSYPVEFMLHGGVGRPAWEPGATLWRRGYDSLAKEDRITVVPGAWRDAYWWQTAQADNLPALLTLLKQRYNVDENRVSLTGVSDGGTGAYFFAFKQPTPWAAFLPYIGHPGVLRNANSGGGYSLFFENLVNKPMYIVNGEVDRLYPAKSVMPFIEILEEAGVDHRFKVIKDGGHNTNWLPEETPLIEAFKEANPRDPFPDRVQWVADRTDRYNRNHWLLINSRSKRGSPAILDVTREQNSFQVSADGVGEFTLLLSPSEIDFNEPVSVTVNGNLVFNGKVTASSQTLLDWVRQDMDRQMLFLAELTLDITELEG